MFARRYVLGTETNVQPLAPVTPVPLPEGSLIVPKKVYSVLGQNFNLDTEGLLIFNDPAPPSYTRRVYVGNFDDNPTTGAWPASAINIDKFIGAVGMMRVRGQADDALTISQKTEKMLSAHVRMSCGTTTDWIEAWVKTQFGWGFRQVSFLTAGTPNNYSDGHVMCEIKPPGGEWLLYDGYYGCAYKHATTGARLSAKTLIESNGNFVIDMLGDNGILIDAAPHVNVKKADGTLVSPAPTVDIGFDEATQLIMEGNTPEARLAKAKAVYQLPGIWTDNPGAPGSQCKYFMPAGTESRASYVTGLSSRHVVITQTEWNSTFYP